MVHHLSHHLSQKPQELVLLWPRTPVPVTATGQASPSQDTPWDQWRSSDLPPLEFSVMFLSGPHAEASLATSHISTSLSSHGPIYLYAGLQICFPKKKPVNIQKQTHWTLHSTITQSLWKSDINTTAGRFRNRFSGPSEGEPVFYQDPRWSVCTLMSERYC